MQISEIRVRLVEKRNDRLKAFCSVTFDDEFVIRDVKIIEGVNGLFVAMPSRKVTDRCPSCRTKNHLQAKYCNECGKRLKSLRQRRRDREKLHDDIAHPINSSCREMLQAKLTQAYKEEVEKSQQPGYVPPRMSEHEDDYSETFESSKANSDSMEETTEQFEHQEANHTSADVDYRSGLDPVDDNISTSQPDREQKKSPPGPIDNTGFSEGIL